MNVFDIFNKQSPIKGKHLKEDSNMPVAVDSTSPIHGMEENEAGYRNYDDNRTGFGRRSRDMDDEANMMYRYDTVDGKLKQRMVANPQRQQANDAGFRDTPEQALRAHNIIRSKFDANKYVQKQGAKWVPVYPYGQQGVAEGSQRVDSLVTDALKIMKGAELNDAVSALKTVLGNREYNDRRGHYSFYVRQLIDMYSQQHMSEEKVRLDPKCWTGKKIGNPKTKMKGGVRVNNCVPAESVAEGERTMSRAAKGYEKYGKAGMQALAKAGREGKDLDKIRNKYNKYDEDVAEGWKSTLAGAALAGAAALGGAGAAQAADLSSFNTQYLQQVANGEHPRPMVSVDDARAELQARTNGKQQTVTPEPKPQTPNGYSIDYLKKAADPERTGRYLISVEKAQELLKQATTVKEQSVAEDTVDNPVAGAITRRILLQRTDLLSKYGPALVTQAIDEVADYVGDVEEIGSSDVSGWIRQVEQMLANNPPEAFGVAENKKEVEYDAEWDEKVRRVGQMAKEGPRKTVWDPVKRVYKTVPVNSPKEEISNDVLESRLYAMKRAGYDIV